MFSVHTLLERIYYEWYQCQEELVCNMASLPEPLEFITQKLIKQILYYRAHNIYIIHPELQRQASKHAWAHDVPVIIILKSLDLESSCTALSSSLTEWARKRFALVATISEGDVKLWSCMVVMAMWTTWHGINLIGNHLYHALLRAARVANGAIPPLASMPISKPHKFWTLLHAVGLQSGV
jgi:hypothetical protein